MVIFENKHYKLLKENLTLIVVIPTFLGGVWQVIELARISISFIRFFSVTQLVPDGLLMCFLLSLLYFGYKIFALRDKDDDSIMDVLKVNDAIEDLRQPSKSIIIWHIGWIILTSIALTFAVFPMISKEFVSRELSGFTFFLLPFSLVLFVGWLKSFFVLSFYVASKVRYSILKVFIKAALRIFIMPALLTLIAGIIYVAGIMHDSFAFPKNLRNVQHFEMYLMERKISSQIELLYFNDKYVFVQYDDSMSTIEVFEFHSLFKTDLE